MVAMEVRDEDGPDSGEVDVGTPQKDLCSLAAVDKEQLAPHVDDLCRGIVLQGGQCASTSEDMNLKGFHQMARL